MQQSSDRNSLTNLTHFLLTGSLGNMSTMPTRQVVETVLGAPTVVEDKADVVPNEVLHILYYNNVEITYIGNNFFQLAIYFRKQPTVNLGSDIPMSFEVDWYPIVKKWNFETFHEFLSSENIPCRKVLAAYPTREDGITLEVTMTGIWICFNAEPLHFVDSIFYTPSRPGNWQYESVV